MGHGIWSTAAGPAGINFANGYLGGGLGTVCGVRVAVPMRPPATDGPLECILCCADLPWMRCRLTQQSVAIKRIKLPSVSAEAELQTYILLGPFPHQHLLRMLDYWVTIDDDVPSDDEVSPTERLLMMAFPLMATSLWETWQASAPSDQGLQLAGWYMILG